MKIEHSEYYSRLSGLITETKSLVSENEILSTSGVMSKLTNAENKLNSSEPIRIVFTGEFSAGKSSIISGLTGKDLFISADVATKQTSEYPWNGLIFVDTPGVQSEDSETDHDMIAELATKDADLVFFVITNELFGPRLAEHFQYIIGDAGLKLSMKTALIVNKIEREVNPDSELVGEINKVLENHLVPIYFCSAKKYLKSLKSDETQSEKFKVQSRFDELVEGINTFVRESGERGRLETPILAFEECLDEISQNGATNENKLKFEEIRLQKQILKSGRLDLNAVLKKNKYEIESIFSSQSNACVEQLSESASTEEIEQFLDQRIVNIESEIEQLHVTVVQEILDIINNLNQELSEIGSISIDDEILNLGDEKIDKKGTQIKGAESKSNAKHKFFGTISHLVAEKAQDATFDPVKLKSIYKSGAKKFNRKMIPWEATKFGNKAANYLGKASKAAPFLVATYDAYTQYRDDSKREKQEQHYAETRLSVRGFFSTSAAERKKIFEKAFQSIVQATVQESLEKLEREEHALVAKNDHSEAVNGQIQDLIKSCSELRNLL